MGLTAETELSLEDAGLIDFFNANKKAFVEMAVKAYTYSKEYVENRGLPVRQATTLQRH